MHNFPYILKETAEGFRPITIETELLSERAICIFGLIDDALAEAVFQQFRYLESQGVEPIELVINSPGGGINAGFAICDFIRCCSVPVRTIVIGSACSIASIIAICGDERLIYPNASIMIHEPTTITSGSNAVMSNAEMEAQTENLSAAKDKLIDLYVQHTSLNKDQLVNYLKGIGTNFTAKQTVEFGFTDRILPYADRKEVKSEGTN